MSDESCVAVTWLVHGIDILDLLCPAVFTTLRVYALTGRNRWIAGVVMVLGLGPFVVNMSTAYQNRVVNLAPPLLCAPYTSASTSQYLTGGSVSPEALVHIPLCSLCYIYSGGGFP
ncbi:hypothetical protein BD413DRAFT_593375 [Trametes elegans]|nr:hypothetical protein BD413DRAFT_593375 [Trametes elegans]